MTPRPLDVDSLQRKLVSLGDLLDQLEDHDEADLVRDTTARHATLWIITQLVSVAAGANAHLVTALTGRSPATQRESFEAMVQAGVLADDLLDDLRGACGMRNVLVHEYDEIDLGLVARAIPGARRTFAAYVEQVAGFLLERGSS